MKMIGLQKNINSKFRKHQCRSRDAFTVIHSRMPPSSLSWPGMEGGSMNPPVKLSCCNVFNYHPPTKLREGNVFSRVCLPFCLLTPPSLLVTSGG